MILNTNYEVLSIKFIYIKNYLFFMQFSVLCHVRTTKFTLHLMFSE